jgi:S1-C subfamily serine protease
MAWRGTVLIALFISTLFAAGCTLGAEETTTSTTQPTTTTEPPFDPLAWAEDHVVGISSEGTFAEDAPAGFGAGLVVDEDGLILVAATAVVGADRVNVTIAGEEFPIQGRVEALAECSNLALVAVDHRFPSAGTLGSGDQPAAWVSWVDDGEWKVSPAGSAEVWPAAVVFDAEGIVTAVASFDGETIAAATAEEILNAMRRRDLVGELDFAGVDQGDGSVLVTGVQVGSAPAQANLMAGDVITQVGSEPLTGGLAELCDTYPDSSTSLEFVRAGSRYEGDLLAGGFHPGSWRSIAELQEAVVRIDVQDYDGDGILDGTGSGFFVSPDGYILTNRHVVVGVDDVIVTWDGGERTAAGTVVGKSSCADLALIDVEGSDYVYLEWTQAPLAIEQPVRTIGFPLGTANLTFKSGSVSKQQVDPFPWTPTIDMFEHSAQIIGGNSGGPVLTEHGEVVGVTNAAGEFGAAQEPFAIVGAGASEYVPLLIEGDVEHLGASIWPFEDWLGAVIVDVIGVDPGSLADEVGLLADPWSGDVITRFGDLDELSGNLTTREICRTLEEQSGAIPMEVYRWADGRYGEGELRGSSLEFLDPFFVFSPDDIIGAEVPGRWTGYTPLQPDDDNDFFGFRAGRSSFDFRNNFGREPYMRLLASVDLSAESTTSERLSDEDYSGLCAERQRFDVSDWPLVGHGQEWWDCSSGYGIRSYAVLDLSQEPSPMILLLVVDRPRSLYDNAERAFDSLVMREFPIPEEPVSEEEG